MRAALFLATFLSLGTPPAAPTPELVARAKVLVQELSAEDPRARSRAEEELLGLGPEAAEALLLLFRRVDAPEQEAIRSLLPKYGPSAIERIYFGGIRDVYRERLAEEESFMAVARMGEVAIPEVMRLIDSGPKTAPTNTVSGLDGLQGFGVGVLRRIGPNAVPQLASLLSHSNANVRRSAAAILPDIDDPRSRDALLGGLSSPDGGVRMYAAVGLGRLRERRAVEPLLKRLHDESDMVRGSAAAALARMYEPRFRGPLVRMARSDVPPSRETAARALLEWSHDPIAERLARRYRPINIDPVAETPIKLRLTLELFVTALVLYLVLWAGAKLTGKGGLWWLPWALWASGGVALALGFFWGRVIVEVSGRVELLLLFAWVPAAACLAWLGGGLKPLLLPAAGLGLGAIVLMLSPLLRLGFAGLLWVAIPQVPRLLIGSSVLALVWGWWCGRRLDAEKRTAFRRSAWVGTATFYVGYGVGSLALWGYLGV